MAGKSDISKKQRDAIRALCQGYTHDEAAMIAGISSRTLYRYKKDEVFNQALDEATSAIMRDSVTMLIGISPEAVQRLKQLIQDDSTPPGVQVSAARVIFDNTVKLSELWLLEERIAALEDRLQDQQQNGPMIPKFDWSYQHNGNGAS